MHETAVARVPTPASKMDAVRQLLAEGVINIHEIQRRMAGRWGMDLAAPTISSYKSKIINGYADRGGGVPTPKPRVLVQEQAAFACMKRLHSLCQTFGVPQVEQALQVYKSLKASVARGAVPALLSAPPVLCEGGD